jgi:hypothetical protein
MQNTYESIPDFDQTTQCVVQGEPVDTEEGQHYPVYVIDLPQEIVDGKETSMPVDLKISKEGTVSLDDLATAEISVSDIFDKTDTVSLAKYTAMTKPIGIRPVEEKPVGKLL